MAVHGSRLTHAETVAEGTMAFHFERPAGFSHRAGQSLLLTLIDPQTDAQGGNRTFTIASAPHEADLMIATRMRDSAFKRVLRWAPPGTPVRIEGPNGVMVLHEEAARPAVFLAGGIGVTPFLAMTRDAAQRRLPHRIHLFYSNRRPEDAAFLAEMQERSRADPNFRLVATMTEPEDARRPWSGETGFIRPEMLERHLADPRKPVYYLAGPPGMTMAMETMLAKLGVSPDDVLSEEFYGY